ncbi:hypothetical protein J0H58_18285 [bacterium]|nr:hypothetical protein [bacterium]
MTTGARLGGGFLALTALCGVALSASGPAGEAPTKAELGGIALLHRQAVKLFIDRTGFGFARMEPPLTDVLGPPKSQGDSSPIRSVGPTSAAIRAGADGKGSHFSFAKAVGTAAFIPPPVPGKAWVVKDVQLVGLVKHTEPVVYLTGGTAAAREKTETKTRRPDAFEAKALEVIRGGGELVQAEKRGGMLRAVSGIYAGQQCLKCHERPGEMLGAFTYRLALEDPPAKGAGFGAGLPLEP